jgi:hypothetical protein
MHEPRSVSPASSQSRIARREREAAEGPEYAHALLFTGHMIDRADRKQPRFPASAEERVRNAIREAISAVRWTNSGSTIALAGAASGGDLLFHECCAELDIPSRVLLPMPPREFEAASVAPAGRAWVERFHALLERAGPGRIQMMKREGGLRESDAANVWQRANLWMIEEAMSISAEQALLALWDGMAGDGPGGTAHFLAMATEAGIGVLPVIPIQTLLAPER